MAEGAYNQAIPLLEFVRKHSVEPELKAVAVLPFLVLLLVCVLS